MKPYCLIIIKDQTLSMEYFFEYSEALARCLEASNQYGEIEGIIYRTDDNVICATMRTHLEGGDEDGN